MTRDPNNRRKCFQGLTAVRHAGIYSQDPLHICRCEFHRAFRIWPDGLVYDVQYARADESFRSTGFFRLADLSVLGIAIAYALAKPVQNGLDQLDGGVATPEGPMDISRRREEDGNDVVANKGAGVNLEDHKPVVDRIPSSGVGSSFVADPQGGFLQSDRGRNSPSTLTGHQCCYPRRFCRRLAGRRL